MLFTSLFMYLSEAALFWMFAIGFWAALGRFAPRLRRVFSNCSSEQLRLFAFWQVVFIAAWSVLFKIGLPPIMHSVNGPLFKGDSQIYANMSELIGTLAILFGIWRGVFFTATYTRKKVVGQ